MKFAPENRRIVTMAAALIPLIVFIVVGMTVTVPYVAMGPGPTANTLGEYQGEDIIEISGAPVDKTSGNLNLTTVAVRSDLTLFDAIGTWVSGRYALTPREQVYPPGKSNEEVATQNRQLMGDSEKTAIAVALNYLKVPTTLVVDQIGEGSPASAALKPGDLITAVGGQPVSKQTDVTTLVRKHKPGEKLTFDVVRDGKKSTKTITLVPRPDDAKVAYVGVTASERPADPNFSITLKTGDIGGPSAGLMLTLGIIDMLSPGELNGGKFIAGTGTIAADGTVGPIGGITHKLLAAREAGAQNFLVPAANCVEAKSDTPDGLNLVKVENLTSALDDLAAIRAGKPAPSC